MAKYTWVISELLEMTDVDKLSDRIRELAKEGVLDGEFIGHLADCAAGRQSEPFPAPLLRALIYEIRRTVYISPKLPAYLSELFNRRIREVLNPPNVYAVESMLDEMKENGLLVAPFAVIFRNALETGDLEAFIAEEYWEMCLERLDDKEREKLEKS